MHKHSHTHAQEMVFYGSVSDGDDVQDTLVTEAGAVGRWNPDIMSGKSPQVSDWCVSWCCVISSVAA
jgi:hypothetical protein